MRQSRSSRPSATWSTRTDPRIARTEGAMAKAAAERERRPVSPVEHLTPKERSARGKATRRAVPRASHADWSPAADRPDPIEILQEQAATRLPELVPIRYGRMLVSPFTFYRG